MLRYIVERIADGEFLDLELPITVSGAGVAVNGPGSLSGTVAPDVGGLRDDAGVLIIDPYATLIHEEADGVIRGTWLVTRSELDGAVWSVEGAGFSSFFRDRPYEGEYRGVQVDPVAVARHVVTHAQSFVSADLGVTVVGSSTVKVGSTSDNAEIAAQAAADAAKAAVESTKAALEAARAAAKADPSPANKAVVETRKAAADAAAATKKTRDEALKVAKETVREDGGAWKILWWDTPDCFQAMQEAVDAAGMEWVEWSGWNSDRTAILKEIRVVPRVGRKQDGLQFVEGDNIVETVVVEDDADLYANKVIAIGAGEGRDALRVTIPGSDNRRSKPHVLDAKNVTKLSVLERMARAELDARMRRLRVDAIRVDASHPNAERGTFGVGDTILVDAEVGWIGRQRLWQRIEEIEWVGLDVCDLMLGDA
ncbi:hypothetical protein MUN76_15390 [Leucobacter rhizosphaerae]|uniref:Minor tail protein n=1 Tax=Leucobacter rhizosphaerae TaxID=2932245 RepID=A0ABY4FVV1_9MICO|nr:hypothetical protein [Leucobacter rhizosphaerae]UOQ60392.1 hypothetical protein MUN76_15390 [Leucobacter rhizosphaerae]